MANKKLKVGGSENLKLPAKKDKSAAKPKWQAKIGGWKGKPEPLVETPEVLKAVPHSVNNSSDSKGRVYLSGTMIVCYHNEMFSGQTIHE